MKIDNVLSYLQGIHDALSIVRNDAENLRTQSRNQDMLSAGTTAIRAIEASRLADAIYRFKLLREKTLGATQSE